MKTSSVDELELELRRLPHVVFVAMADDGALTTVQVVAPASTDPSALRLQAEQLCRYHVDGAFRVDVSGGSRPARVRLLDVQIRKGEAPQAASGAARDEEVEVHLGYRGQRTIGRGPAGDPSGAAVATFDALQRLGAKVPFALEAAALFEHELGDGVMVVLTSPAIGTRYGVAAGMNVEQAAARATLHALNRFLAGQAFPAAAVATA